MGEAEVKTGFAHVRSLDSWDLEGIVSWNYRIGDTGNYAYGSVGGGLRHESVGSFNLTRYPLGFGLGFRALVARAAGIRIEYQFRRILNDPVSDFSEHQILLGVSLFFNNG